MFRIRWIEAAPAVEAGGASGWLSGWVFQTVEGAEVVATQLWAKDRFTKYGVQVVEVGDDYEQLDPPVVALELSVEDLEARAASPTKLPAKI